ncbi:NAD(P)/FAD-dependent oxidoreductase [Daejeonella oryzae]|uniref:NAD(P)/FAD-dependent oxidoreductase n=1 Tax=Daejeonella oryzae TaxID=1122943 RepID=UPI0003FFDCC3|nr:FAD-binding oxidoreductase [Daejeonella oryzae]
MNTSISYWEQNSFFSNYDVIIVGSGIVGLSAALNLKLAQPLLNIAILDAGFLPSGASTKNAGFACFGSISEMIEELETSTEDELLEVVSMRWKGLERLLKYVGKQPIDYQLNSGYEIFRNAETNFSDLCTDKINYFNKLLNSVLPMPDIFAVNNAKISEFGFGDVRTIIQNKYEGQIDTGKMMKVFIQRVQYLGVSIFNNCNLQRIEQTDSHLNLICNQGIFQTKKVVLATNAFISNLFPDLDVKPGRGQVLITEPIKDLKIKGTFHYDKGYYYFRNIHNRILIGGGRNLDFKAEETQQMGITDHLQFQLENLLQEVILPGIKVKIEQRWSGIMAFGETLKPIITQLQPNVFCAVRCNGMGIAIGSLMGEQVANLILSS